MRILPLSGSHDRKAFDCGRPEPNSWLEKIAGQHQKRGISKTSVAVLEETPTCICGYYALTLTEVDTRALQEKDRKQLPHIIPGVRLGRLAVDQRYQGKRLGEILRMDAVERVRSIRRHAGVVGLFVDALDEEAAGFYARYGFTAFIDHPLKLFLPL